MGAESSLEIESGHLTVLPRAVAFDLDDTLAESFQPPKPEMMARIRALLEIIPVAIITGAGFDRIKAHVLSQMPETSRDLYLFPNSSSQCFICDR